MNTPENQIKVYRNGTLSIGEHNSAVKKSWGAIDTFAPDNYARRLDSLFAAPDINGVIRWVKSKHMLYKAFGYIPGDDLTTHEITVLNLDALFVHRISDYDAIARGHRVSRSEAEMWHKTGIKPFADWDEIATLMKAYWTNAIRLSDWNKIAADNDWDSTEWEVLIPLASIVSTTELADEKLLEACSNELSRHELSALIEEARF